MSAQILEAIWNWSWHQDGAPYAAMIDRKNGDKYTEHRLPRGNTIGYSYGETPGVDAFFSPLFFKGDRKNKNALAPTILFADLDNVRALKDRLDTVWPHVLWMTSKDNAQAVWFLRSGVPDLNAWSELNQRMTYYLGADKGGWHASKLLRVPGSLNWKYDPPHRGMVVSFQPKATPYEAEALRDTLPALNVGRGATTSAPMPIPQEEWKAHLAKIWRQLPLRTRSDLLAPGMRDRSEALVRASNKMRFAGISPEDQFHALWWTEWNKFRTDHTRPEKLWEIVSYEG